MLGNDYFSDFYLVLWKKKIDSDTSLCATVLDWLDCNNRVCGKMYGLRD